MKTDQTGKTNQTGRIAYPCLNAAYAAMRRDRRSQRIRADFKRLSTGLPFPGEPANMRNAAVTALRWGAAPVAVLRSDQPCRRAGRLHAKRAGRV